MTIASRVKLLLARAVGSPWILVQTLAVVMVLAYVGASMQLRRQNQESIRRLQAQVERLRTDYVVLADALQLRVTALEATTYVDVLETLSKQPKLVARPREAWERNRDQQINQRLENLERWRYIVDGKLP